MSHTDYMFSEEVWIDKIEQHYPEAVILGTNALR